MMGLNLKTLRLFFLLLGVIVSWTATISAFLEFYGNEGTIFKIKNCVIPNPITTPCFWGAIAFFAALLFAIRYLKKENLKFERNFFYLMIFSIIFAWVNFGIELRGIKPRPGALITVCKPAQNPFLSPCFFGSILFTLSFTTSWLIKEKTRKTVGIIEKR